VGQVNADLNGNGTEVGEKLFRSIPLGSEVQAKVQDAHVREAEEGIDIRGADGGGEGRAEAVHPYVVLLPHPSSPNVKARRLVVLVQSEMKLVFRTQRMEKPGRRRTMKWHFVLLYSQTNSVDPSYRPCRA
jgi:hypothetical protein